MNICYRTETEILQKILSRDWKVSIPNRLVLLYMYGQVQRAFWVYCSYSDGCRWHASFKTLHRQTLL